MHARFMSYLRCACLFFSFVVSLVVRRKFGVCVAAARGATKASRVVCGGIEDCLSIKRTLSHDVEVQTRSATPQLVGGPWNIHSGLPEKTA